MLSREACQRLAAPPQHRVLSERFADSLLADEIAVQTVLYATPIGAGLTLDRANRTFVALPDRGGTADVEFTEASLRTAREQEYLFIRKRPHTLPAELAADLEAMAGLQHSCVKVA